METQYKESKEKKEYVSPLATLNRLKDENQLKSLIKDESIFVNDKWHVFFKKYKNDFYIIDANYYSQIDTLFLILREKKTGKKVVLADYKPIYYFYVSRYNRKPIYFLNKSKGKKVITNYSEFRAIERFYDSAIKNGFSVDRSNFVDRLLDEHILPSVGVEFDIYNDFPIQTLVQQHFQKPDNYNIAYFDIEVLSQREFPLPEKALYPIVSIAIYKPYKKEFYYFYYLVDKKNKLDETKVREYIKEDKFFNESIDFKFINCKTEKDLLKQFFSILNDVEILTGWNSINFDFLYILNRSFNLKLKKDFYRVFGIPKPSINDKGFENFYTSKIVLIDYQHLLKTFEYSASNLESYTLDFVAKMYLGEEAGKVDIERIYYEYNNNFENFTYYNIKDAYIVYKLNELLKIFESIATLKKLSGGFPFSIYSTNHIIEGFLCKLSREENVLMIGKRKKDYNNKILFDAYLKVNDLHIELLENEREFNMFVKELSNKEKEILKKVINENNLSKIKVIKIFDSYERLYKTYVYHDKNKITFIVPGKKYPGGHVKDPQKGVHLFLVDLDAESLYPTTMLATKISHETFRYLIPENLALKWIFEREYFEEDVMETLNKDFIYIYDAKLNEFLEIKKEDIYDTFNKILFDKIVTPVGTVFENKSGIITKTVEKLIKNRKKYKSLMKEHKDDPQLSLRYNLLQLTYKVLANSIYGYFGYSKGRLFAYIFAGTITVTAQLITKYTAYNLNRFMNKNLDAIYKRYGPDLLNEIKFF